MDQSSTGSTSAHRSSECTDPKQFIYWHSPLRVCWRVILQNAQQSALNAFVHQFPVVPDDLAILDTILHEYWAYIALYPSGPEAG
jgi:hypothetical protein